MAIHMTRRGTLVAVFATVSVVVLALIVLWPLVSQIIAGCGWSLFGGPEATPPPGWTPTPGVECVD